MSETLVFEEFTKCQICPRNCGINRNAGQRGFCGLDARLAIASIIRHRGEEPPISGDAGIVNVFLMHCNLQCAFCQNNQISHNRCATTGFEYTLEKACEEIARLLDAGCGAVGFVSPSHYIPYVKAIVHKIRQMGYRVPIVYNTNGYDSVEEIKALENYIDVWLPDFKYSSDALGKKFSKVSDYTQVALAALKEMYRQKGSTLLINDHGYAESGMIIRHLALPGYVDNSLQVLDTIAWELSTNVHISLMSQYNPKYYQGTDEAMKRTLHAKEYQQVVDKFHELGFYRGWIQELDSYANYNPDFGQEHPFE
ncbi:MAG: radical SAM protein [Bacteroidales bacterium]